MRALIVSDIHANLEAFEAVLADAQRRGGYDVVWFLGDLVGYNADPSACIALLQSLPGVSIAGNHDHAVVGKIDPIRFNGAARAAAIWTAARLSGEELEYLSGWPEVQASGEFTMVHGSLRDHVSEYLLSQDAALATFSLLPTQFCLVGHSHIPLLWIERGDRAEGGLLNRYSPLQLEPGQRLIVNPGSVGQPRDGDWRASYVLYDSDAGHGLGAMEHFRAEYDIATTQAKIRDAGLPESLANRLTEGR